MRETSPGANISSKLAASRSRNRTLPSSRAQTRSMATTMASGTFSTAAKSMSGCCAAISAVKRPLPQPSSRCSWEKAGKSLSQRPRRSSGALSSTAAHCSMRGIRLGFFLILKALTLPQEMISHSVENINEEKVA